MAEDPTPYFVEFHIAGRPRRRGPGDPFRFWTLEDARGYAAGIARRCRIGDQIRVVHDGTVKCVLAGRHSPRRPRRLR